MAVIRAHVLGETTRNILPKPIHNPVWLPALAFCVLLLLMQALMGSGIDLYAAPLSDRAPACLPSSQASGDHPGSLPRC